jgi:hypothetical protein
MEWRGVIQLHACHYKFWFSSFTFLFLKKKMLTKSICAALLLQSILVIDARSTCEAGNVIR